MSDFADLVEHEARLVLLRILAEQPDLRLNSSLLRDGLSDQWAINKTREWVHLQIDYLASLGAVKKTDIGAVKIVELTARGLDHVERRSFLPAVKRPSPIGG